LAAAVAAVVVTLAVQAVAALLWVGFQRLAQSQLAQAAALVQTADILKQAFL
jgi:hypothetical protein